MFAFSRTYINLTQSSDRRERLNPESWLLIGMSCVIHGGAVLVRQHTE